MGTMGRAGCQTNLRKGGESRGIWPDSSNICYPPISRGCHWREIRKRGSGIDRCRSSNWTQPCTIVAATKRQWRETFPWMILGGGVWGSKIAFEDWNIVRLKSDLSYDESKCSDFESRKRIVLKNMWIFPFPQRGRKKILLRKKVYYELIEKN